MLDTLTVWSSAAFSDGRQLPRASKWVPTDRGFAFEASGWRIDVSISAAVAPADVPVEVRAARASAAFRTDVTLAPDTAPHAAREFFEWTARNIALMTSGVVAVDAPAPTSPGPTAPLVQQREPRAYIIDPRPLEARGITDRSPLSLNARPRFTAAKLLGIAVLFGALAWSLWFGFVGPNPALHPTEVPSGRRIPFDSSRWIAAELHDEPKRVRMVDDLIERRLLIGLSMQEATRWLGPPFDARATESPALERKLAAWDFAFRAGSLVAPPSAVWEAVYVVVRTDAASVIVDAGVVWP